MFLFFFPAPHQNIGGGFLLNVSFRGKPVPLKPLVELLAIEIELLSVRTEVRDLPGAGEFVKMAFAHFEVQAGFLEAEDFFLQEGLPDEQFFDMGEFFEYVSLLSHPLDFFNKGREAIRKKGVVQPGTTPF